MNALELVQQQAEDEGLWFTAERATEAYLQQELRKLHAAVEDHRKTTEPPLLARHLGCGDGLMLAGAAVELAKEFGGLRFPCWEGHEPTFREIFKSVPEIEVIPVQDEHEMFQVQRTMILTGYYKKAPDYWIRLKMEDNWRKALPFDARIYGELQVPLEKKWESFPWKGDLRVEYNRPYIFVHDDASRGYVIDTKRHLGAWPQELMIAPGHHSAQPITYYAPYIVNAHEIHVINSAFLWLADLLPLPEQQRKYFHRYARPWNVCDIPTLRHQWTILD